MSFEKKPILLLCLDLDGTLLGPDKQVSPVCREMLHEIRGTGVAIAIASGRHPFNVFALMDFLRLPHTATCLSGAVAFLNGREILSHKIDPVVMREIIGIAEKNDIYVSVSGSDFNLIYGPINRGTSSTSTAVSRYTRCTSYRELASRATELAPRVLKCALHATTDELYDHLRDELSALDDVEVAQSDTHWVDITAKDCTKAEGVRALAASLKIDMSAVAVVGDDENDLAALKVAGFSIAMGNASPEIQGVADAIVADNAHDGAAEAMRLILLRNKGVQIDDR